MLNWILNSISNYKKDKNQKKYNIQNPTEIEISEKFESYFIDCFEYEGCTKIIENYSELNLNSNLVNSIITNKSILEKNFENEFELKSFVFLNIGHPRPNKNIVIFSFYRKCSENFYDTFELIGSFIKNRENNIKILFLNFDQKIFNHYYFNKRIEVKNILNLKHSNSNYCYSDFYIDCNSYYFYNFKNNKIEYIINLPVIQLGNSELNIQIAETELFPSTTKSYSIEFYLEINGNNFCQEYKGRLYYGEDIIRDFDFDIYTHNDFLKAIEKLLFPFTLPNDKKIELGLENVSLEQIKNTFDKEFEIYQKFKI
jgi:hypothetical protein